MAGLIKYMLEAAFPATAADLSALIGPTSQRGGKGAYGRCIIRTEQWGGRVFELHATKGWRSYRATSQDKGRGE